MYFPYLRGRQFELIAIRELLENNLISDKIIPIIEPVRASSTLLKTIVQCKNANQPLAFIINPQVGSYLMEIKGSSMIIMMMNMIISYGWIRIPEYCMYCK